MSDFDPQGNYSNGDFTPPAEGRHIFQVTEATVKKSKKGNLMLEIRCMVVDQEDDSYGKSCLDWFTYMPDFFWKLQKLTKAINPQMVARSKENPDGFAYKSQSSVDRHILGGLVTADVNHVQGEYEDDYGMTKKITNGRLTYYESLTKADRKLIDGQYGPEGPSLEPGGSSGSDDSDGPEGYSDDDIPF